MKRYKNANETIHAPEALNRALLTAERRTAPRRTVALLTAAVLLCSALAATVILFRETQDVPPVVPDVTTAPSPSSAVDPTSDTVAPRETESIGGAFPLRITQVEYPAQTQIPHREDYAENAEQYWQDMQAWTSEGYNRVAESRAAVGRFDVNGTYVALMRQFLTSTEKTAGQNRLLSPLNLYLALSMLTELTDGESRAQLLSLLGSPDLETARTRANTLWTANYLRGGATTSVLASSLWMSDGVDFRREPIDRLAEYYYAESYRGRMGSPELDEALRTWLNTQTGGLLADAVRDVSLDPRTVLALATTIFYEGKWDGTFNEANNTTDLFHASAGDEEIVFMNKSGVDTYYWGEGYSAVALELESHGGKMWFFLPDEGTTPDQLLADGRIFDVALGRNSGENKTLIVNLSVPKFDVSAKFDLNEGLKALGITDVWSPETADFSPVTADGENELFLSQAEHAVRVKIDEDGCSAAAYTLMAMAGMGAPPREVVDFVLDRPFVFILVSATDTPLFAGVVETMH